MIPIQDKGEVKTFSEWVSLNENNRWLAGEGYESLTPLSKDVMDSAIKRYMEWLKSIPQSSLKEEAEYEWARFKDDFLVMCDRYLRDCGASNTDTHECISLALEDFKSSLTPKSIRDRPSTEDVKRWFQLLVGRGEEAMQEDMEASLKIKSIRDSEAIEFAKFILKDYEIVSLKKSEDVEEYYYWQLAGTYQTYTTEELYGDFNKLASLKPNKIGDPIDKFKWSELEKIASPEKWMKMYKAYSEMLTHEDVSSWWQEQFNIANAERNELKLSAEKYQIAIANLIEAIPSQTNDKDWWPDSLTDAVNEANKLLENK